MATCALGNLSPPSVIKINLILEPVTYLLINYYALVKVSIKLLPENLAVMFVLTEVGITFYWYFIQFDP